ARLFRSRPGPARWQNPLAVKDGQPGVVFRWLEVEGPIYEQWPPAGHKLLFGDLPMATRKAPPKPQKKNRTMGETNAFEAERRFSPPPGVEVLSKNPKADAERLLRNFMTAAYRQPVAEAESPRFLAV